MALGDVSCCGCGKEAVVREDGNSEDGELHFEVGDLVLAHLRKERFSRGTYNKLKMKKIGPCRVLRKFGVNSYEIELPDGIEISPIFNISDLYPYRAEETKTRNEQLVIQWTKQMPVAENP